MGSRSLLGHCVDCLDHGPAGQDPVELFSEVDGNFPNHPPDTSNEDNLTDLIAAVKEHGADIGIGYDGDADRVGVVDENGDVVFASDRSNPATPSAAGKVICSVTVR